jgi:outer membrane murein-binding lipoprotein Lpp
MAQNRFVRKNKENFIWGAVMLGAIAFSAGDLQKSYQKMQVTKDEISQNNEKVQQMETNMEFLRQQAEIAAGRFESGCLLVANDGRKVNLIQGQTVVDRITKKPLPKNTVVCDSNGNTGVLLPRDFDGDGKKTVVVAETAFTGDSTIVKRYSDKTTATVEIK